MAADQLATPQDLASLLQLDYDTLTAVQQATMTMLVELATAKVQRAAGGQRIVEATDTAVIDVDPWECDVYLPLPQLPVQSVTAVLIDGTAVSDWRLSKQMLYRSAGWRSSRTEPTQVTVTSKHGYAPGSQWLELARDHTLALARMPFTNPDGTLSEAIDDYRVTRAEADARMQMTEPMRLAIADAYGTSAHVTGSR